jgi:2-polyprenyl-3-methyl-5-hydroxy-6-metoxy-1,4-benzoquinol methylase
MKINAIKSKEFTKYLRIRQDFIKFLEKYNINNEISLIPNEWINYSNKDQNTRLANDVFQLDKSLLPESKICDFGANPPILSYMLHSLGHKVTSIDYSEKDWFSESLKKDLGLLIYDIESKGLKNLMINESEFGLYDAVTLTETFEHLRIDPIQLMLEIRSILKYNGLLYLTTPNVRRFDSIISIIFDRPLLSRSLHLTYSHLRIRGFSGHYREFSINEIDDFLSKMGFEKIYSGSIDATLLENKFFPNKTINWFKKSFIYTILKDNIFFKLGIGESLYFLYKKKEIKTTSYQFGEEVYAE